MYSPATKPVAWYFTAALISFVGALLFDGFSVALSIVQPSLFHVWLYFFSALFTYLTIFFFYAAPRPSRYDQVLFGLLLFLFAGSFYNGTAIMVPVGLVLVFISLWFSFRVESELLARSGLIALGAIGFYLVSVGKILHAWMGGAVILLWVTGYCWYALEANRAREDQVHKVVRWTWVLVLIGGFIGSIYPSVLSALVVVEASPLIILWLSQLRSGRDRFWTVLLICVVVLNSWRSVAWPVLVVGLILCPRRHRRRMLGLIPWESSQPSEKLLRWGVVLFFFGLWVRQAIICLLGNALLISGFLIFIRGQFCITRHGLPPGDSPGEGHII